MTAKQIRITLTLSEKERDYLLQAYRRYVTMETGEILTLNKWLLNRVIEALQ